MTLGSRVRTIHDQPGDSEGVVVDRYKGYHVGMRGMLQVEWGDSGKDGRTWEHPIDLVEVSS